MSNMPLNILQINPSYHWHCYIQSQFTCSSIRISIEVGIVVMCYNAIAFSFDFKLLFTFSLLFHLQNPQHLKFSLLSNNWNSELPLLVVENMMLSLCQEGEKTWKPKYSSISSLALVSFCESQMYLLELSGTSISICWFPRVSSYPLWVWD